MLAGMTVEGVEKSKPSKVEEPTARIPAFDTSTFSPRVRQVFAEAAGP